MLGRLAAACAGTAPRRLAANASRCPDLVIEEIERSTGMECMLMFEERPLGVCGTLSRLAGVSGGGDWLVCNTDAVTDLDFVSLVGRHLERRADWTAVLGRMPSSGGYRPVGVSPEGTFPSSSGSPRHYWGFSVVGSRVLEAALRHRNDSLFSGLAAACSAAGMRLEAFDASGEWLDTGDAEHYRVNLLSRPPVVREGAVIEEGAVLEGRWFVGRGCRVASGSVLRDSVMLDGSALIGGVLERSVLPWMERRGGV